MKPNTSCLLACAIAATLSIAGCHNDADQTSSSSDSTAMPVAPSSTMSPASNSSSVAPDSNAMVPDNTVTPAPASSSSGGGLTFDQMDKNHNGSITRAEVPDNDPLKQHFKEADTNHDGKLSRDEFDSFRANGNSASPKTSPGS